MKLAKYLENIAQLNDFSNLNHKYWERFVLGSNYFRFCNTTYSRSATIRKKYIHVIIMPFLIIRWLLIFIQEIRDQKLKRVSGENKQKQAKG